MILGSRLPDSWILGRLVVALAFAHARLLTAAVTLWLAVHSSKVGNLVLTTELKKLTFRALALRQLFYPLRWRIYVFNSVVNTKLPAILSHRGSTTVSLETYPFIHSSKVFDLSPW